MPNLSTLYPANLIASNPILLSMNLDLWDPRLLRDFSIGIEDACEATAHARHRRGFGHNKESWRSIPTR